MERHRAYAIAAAASLVSVAAIELFHAVFLGPWGTLPVAHALGAAIVIVTYTLATAVALLLRERSPRIATLAWLASVPAPWLVVAHGLVLKLVGAPVGLVYLPLALFIGFSLKRSYDGGEIPRLAGRPAYWAPA